MNVFERLRYEKDLTQQEVADGAGISRGTVIKLEQLRDPKPSAPVAKALASFYGVPLAELMPSDRDSKAKAA